MNDPIHIMKAKAAAAERDPTPEEIKERAAEVRRSWGDPELRERLGLQKIRPEHRDEAISSQASRALWFGLAESSLDGEAVEDD